MYAYHHFKELITVEVGEGIKDLDWPVPQSLLYKVNLPLKIFIYMCEIGILKAADERRFWNVELALNVGYHWKVGRKSVWKGMMSVGEDEIFELVSGSWGNLGKDDVLLK